MADHSEHPHGDFPISGSSIVALAQRFATKAMESSGDERLKRLARMIKEAPELLGEKTGPILGKIAKKIGNGGKVTLEDKKELADTLAKNPADAEVIVGYAKASVLEGLKEASEESREILQSYKSACDIVCAYMAKATTSVVLRGFLHDADCFSYWHFERSNLEVSGAKDYLYPNGLQIFILNEEPTAERFASLNLAIRDHKDRHLPSPEYNYEKNETIAKITRINETEIELEQLARDRATRAQAGKGPFGGTFGTDYSRPVEHVIDIPASLDGLVSMIESLEDAKEIQLNRLKGAQKASARIKERR